MLLVEAHISLQRAYRNCRGIEDIGGLNWRSGLRCFTIRYLILTRGCVMRVPLKLSAIDQEHLQELYDAAGVARDELPYSEKFEEIWQGFQDRTFKNAEREQVFGAILKYVRSSSNAASGLAIESKLSD